MPAGRPPVFNSVDELEEAIAGYFETLEKRYIGHDTEAASEVPTFKATITGLALHLGFASRQSFYDYEKNEEFSYSIKRARLMIENDYEQQLRNGDAIPATIFGLKNLGWTDDKGVKLSGDPDNPIEHNVVVEFVGLDVDSSDT